MAIPVMWVRLELHDGSKWLVRCTFFGYRQPENVLFFYGPYNRIEYKISDIKFIFINTRIQKTYNNRGMPTRLGRHSIR